MTQSAISHHIRGLEGKFGHQLMIRSRGAVHLTRYGQILYEAATDIVARYQQLEKALRKKTNEVSGLLRVATTIAVGLHELPHFSTEYLTKYPKVHVKLSYLKAPEIYGHVLNYQVDIGLLACPKRHPQLDVKIFKRDCLALIVSPASQWGRYRQIELQQLSGQPFIALEHELPPRKLIDDVLNRYGVRPNIVHTFDNIESIKQAVRVNLGVSIVPAGTVREKMVLRTLKTLRTKEPLPECPLAVITRKNADLSAPAEAMIRTLLSKNQV